MELTRALATLGVRPRVAVESGKGLATFLKDKNKFLNQERHSGHEFRLAQLEPYLSDRTDHGGVAEGQYFHQDLVVAQEVFSAQPRKHVDVGSRIDGFVAHVASFREIEVHDIRPLETSAANIRFTQRDLTIKDPLYSGYTDSLSCLHTLEHLGLGRYGDTVDYYGYKKGLASLAAMLELDGTLYLSVPVSRDQRVEFNAHRLFSLPYLIQLCSEFGLEVRRTHIVDDSGQIHVDIQSIDGRIESTFDLKNGCGILILKRTEGNSP